MKKLMVVALTLMVMLCFGAISFAGSLDDPGLPTSPSSAMFTLEDIYNRLGTGAAGTKRPGAFEEPFSGPAATGHTLDEVMGLAPTVDDTNGAVPAEILSGKTLWGLTSGDWGLKTGTMPNNGAVTYTPTTTNQTVAAGYHNGSGVVSGDADLVTTNIRSGINIFDVAGDSNVVNTSSGDAGSGDILTGKKAWVDGSEVTGSLTCPPAPTGNAVVGDVLSGKTFSNSGGTGLTGTMTNNGAVNYTPVTTDQTIAEGYHNGSGHVAGDADLSAGNIKAGTEIFGVTGTFPNDGTAATGDVKTGSTFYTDSATKLTGTGTQTLSPANDTVSAGYYEATNLSAVDTDLAAENIKKDVDIFGVIGTYPLAAVAKTGQISCYKSYSPWGTCTCGNPNCPSGQDGDWQKGVEWPSPRFTDLNNGTVRDNLTGLIWMKNAECANQSREWYTAIDYCNALYDGCPDCFGPLSDAPHDCGLSDGSQLGDWRLPNVKELYSLLDLAYYGPALSNDAGTGQWTGGAGSSFTNLETGGDYWTSTAGYDGSNWTYAFRVRMNCGEVIRDARSGGSANHYVWCVRDEQ